MYKAAAEGMLAKVYLTKAGVGGSINSDDLNNAVKYARLCLAHSTHSLMPSYPDVFRLANNINPETLIAWRWNANNNQWTDQSFMQNDYAPKGFGDDDCWAQWAGMSTDLQEAFGIKLLEQTPDIWLNNRDTRLKATMMLPGYKYDYFWTDRGGFEFLRFVYDDTYNPSVELSDKQVPWLSNPTSPQTASSTDTEALQAINSVRQRAGLVALTSVSFEDIWKERRLELAFEGDRWYDYVRVSYYNSDFCVNDLKAQTRIAIGNGTLNDIYENYYKTGDWVVSEETKQAFEESKKREAAPMVEQLLVTDSDTGKKYLAIPMTERDVVFNPNLGANAEAVHVDVRATYSY